VIYLISNLINPALSPINLELKKERDEIDQINFITEVNLGLVPLQIPIKWYLLYLQRDSLGNSIIKRTILSAAKLGGLFAL